MILRLSQRLARKIQASHLDEMPLSSNPCADWSCRLFVAERTEYIIMSNTPSMYSCVMPSKDIAGIDFFLSNLLSTMAEFMKSDEQNENYERFIAPTAANVVFAKSLNRSVTESMSNHVHGSKLYLSDGLYSHEIGLQLNNTRLPALTDSQGHHYAKPREVFTRLARTLQS